MLANQLQDSLPPKSRTLFHERGQSTIEFVFTMAFSLGLVFLFISLAFNFSTGYMVHYANYMASRSYLVADSHGQGDIAPQVARETFQKYNLSLLNIDSSALTIADYHVTGPAHLYVGTKVTFKKLLTYIRFIGGSTEATFRSESFLGKEPTRAECLSRTCYGIYQNETCNQAFDITVDDNGC